jgi:hypothetical protein
MACARNIGLSKLPIVCVNVDQYYEPFRDMLQRAYDEKLTKHAPEQLVEFCDTALDAIQWVETVVLHGTPAPPTVEVQRRKTTLRKSSVLHTPVTGNLFSWSRSSTADPLIEDIDEDSLKGRVSVPSWYTLSLVALGFVSGVAFTTLLTTTTSMTQARRETGRRL